MLRGMNNFFVIEEIIGNTMTHTLPASSTVFICPATTTTMHLRLLVDSLEQQMSGSATGLDIMMVYRSKCRIKLRLERSGIARDKRLDSACSFQSAGTFPRPLSIDNIYPYTCVRTMGSSYSSNAVFINGPPGHCNVL